jgi:hypothetical protein
MPASVPGRLPRRQRRPQPVSSGIRLGRLQPDAVVNLAYLIGCYKLVSPLLP